MQQCQLKLGYEPALEGGPIVVQTSGSTFVLFQTVSSQFRVDTNYHPINIALTSPAVYQDLTRSSCPVAGIAVVEFIHCHVSKFGLPNNDAWAGHPLYSRITEADGWMSFLEVRHSSWKAELERQNKVSYPDWDWPHKHFIISFRQSTFECVAKDIQISVSEASPEIVLQQIMQSVVTDLSKY